MKELFDRLSSYNIFNYLLPGIVFVVFGEIFTKYSFAQKDLILGLFLYYFIGLVISRIGSLIIEPLLKRLHFVQHVEYSDFVSAARVDPKIEILSEGNNMYRTFCALFLVLIAIKACEKTGIAFPHVGAWCGRVLIVGLFILFLFSYRKQVDYIKRRITAEKKQG